VGIVGLGGLGTVAAGCLARAGVGTLRLIDPDIVETSNLPRQILYTEDDALPGDRPKAGTAALRLATFNSEIRLDTRPVAITAANAAGLLAGLDVVLDATDNFAARYAINDACLQLGIPWIYGGAVGDSGTTLNILPGAGPCLRCLMPDIPAPGSWKTSADSGVLNMITGIIGSIQAAETVKLILDPPAARRSLLSINLWDFSIRESEVPRDPHCPAHQENAPCRP
jgi:adenylyltransferase/sulfurtransferase